ncbi:3'-5' exonuclease [Sparganum proliferum]
MVSVICPDSRKFKSVAARVSIVDSSGMIVIDEYCQPPHKVHSYNTEYSGITPDHLIGKMTYSELRSIVSGLIENKLVVGHDLKNDFQALDIKHPAELRFDTAQNRTLRKLAHLPINKKPSLAGLTYRLTGKFIQRGAHDSVEDARAAMALYEIVSQPRVLVHPWTTYQTGNSASSTQEEVQAPMISQDNDPWESEDSILEDLRPRPQNWTEGPFMDFVTAVFLVALVYGLSYLAK